MPNPARVLVVDDSPTILKVVGAILARSGYEIAVARDGLAGIELLRGGLACDLVLLDFVMPRMNGYQFCRELRSSAEHRALPVVLMSAKGDKIRGQFVQQTGAVDAITKPFDARALVAVVEGALAKTAEGRGRPVPEAGAMPEEPPVDSVRPSVAGRQLRQRASVEVAHHIASAVAPAILALPEAQRREEAAVIAAIARALTPEVVRSVTSSVRDLDHAEGSKDVMSGDLAAIPLAEVLQVLQLQRQTGVLKVTNFRVSATLSIRQGLVDLVQAQGGAEEFLLGRYFVEKGLLTRQELDAQVAANQGQLLGDSLVRQGRLSRDDLNEALTKQSCELVYEVLRWSYGRFTFSREPFRPEADEAHLGLGVSGMVLEGFRRVDEWRLMEGTVDFDQVLLVDRGAVEALGPDKVSRTEQRLLDAIDGHRTVGEAIKESAVGSFDAVKTVYQFLQSRLLRPRA